MVATPVGRARANPARMGSGGPFLAQRLLAMSLLALFGCGSDPAPAPRPDVAQRQESPAEKTIEATPEPEPAEPDGPVLNIQQLKQLEANPRLRILDVRHADEYASGHIPGAIHLDISTWREESLKDEGLRDRDYWSAELGKLGITSDTMVVVYGQTVPNIARAWWTLRYLGLDNVQFLERGWVEWKAKENKLEYPIETKLPQVEPTVFEPAFRTELLAELGDVKQAVTKQAEGVVIVDVRSRGEFTGQDALGERGGHIPGAVHLEWIEVVDEAGRFRSPTALKKLFEEKGIKPDATIVTHCQSGGRASVTALALELAGYAQVKNYYCGWQEWSADEELPAETTDAD